MSGFLRAVLIIRVAISVTVAQPSLSVNNIRSQPELLSNQNINECIDSPLIFKSQDGSEKIKETCSWVGANDESIVQRCALPAS